MVFLAYNFVIITNAWSCPRIYIHVLKWKGCLVVFIQINFKVAKSESENNVSSVNKVVLSSCQTSEGHVQLGDKPDMAVAI